MPWKNPWFQYALLLFLAFIWGSSFILMKIGLRSFSSNQAAALRIFSASLVLLPYSIKSIKGLKKQDFKYLLITGFVGSFIPAFLFTKAQTRIDSALAGMLNSMTPVFTLIIGVVIYRFRTKGIQLLGLFIGLVGALGLITAGKEITLGNIDSYALLIILATLCYGVNVNVVKAHLTHLSGIQISSLSFMFIGPFALSYLLASDLNSVIVTDSWGIPFTALMILGIIGTAFAMLIMYNLIRYTTAVFAASVTYIIPVFAISWGFLDGENITIIQLGSMAVVLLGVYLVNRR